jgi:hypothetical protein
MHPKLEAMTISLKREHEVFEEWQDDPLSEFKQALWEKQRRFEGRDCQIRKG